MFTEVPDFKNLTPEENAAVNRELGKAFIKHFAMIAGTKIVIYTAVHLAVKKLSR